MHLQNNPYYYTTHNTDIDWYKLIFICNLAGSLEWFIYIFSAILSHLVLDCHLITMILFKHESDTQNQICFHAEDYT